MWPFNRCRHEYRLRACVVTHPQSDPSNHTTTISLLCARCGDLRSEDHAGKFTADDVIESLRISNARRS